MRRQQLAIFLLCLIILLAPFDYGFFDLQILTINLILSLLLALIWLTSGDNGQQTGFYINSVTISICIFTFVCFFSLIYSVHPYSSFTEVMRLFTYLIIFFVSANFLSRESFQKLFYVIVVWMCLLAIWGLGEYLFAGELEPKSVFAYRGNFAVYLLLTFPLAFALMRNNLRFVYIGILGLFAFIISQSRSGWVSFLMGALVFAPLAVKKICSRSPFTVHRCFNIFKHCNFHCIPNREPETGNCKRLQIYFVIILIFVLLFAFDCLFMSSALGKRAQTLFSPGDIPSAQARIKYWDSALKITGRYFPIGTGVQTFYLVYPFFKHPSFSGCTHHFVHNDYLQVLSELGLPGLIAFLGVVVCYMSALRFAIEKNNRDRSVLSAIYFSSLVFFFSSIFEFNIYIPSLMVLIYFYIAFVSGKRGRFVAIRIGKPALYFTFAIAVTLAAFPYISQVFIKKGDTAFGKNNVQDALADYKRAAFFSPLNYLPQKKLTEIYLRQHRREEALERCINAIRLNSFKRENHALLRVILNDKRSQFPVLGSRLRKQNTMCDVHSSRFPVKK